MQKFYPMIAQGVHWPLEVELTRQQRIYDMFQSFIQNKV